MKAKSDTKFFPRHFYLILNIIVFSGFTVLQFFFFTGIARAESFVTFQVGGTIGTTLLEMTGVKNINFPNPPGPGQVREIEVKGVELNESLVVRFKVGHFFQNHHRNNFGIELDTVYFRPDSDGQNVTQIINSVPNTGFQLPLDMHVIVVGFNGLYRFNHFDYAMPYIGIGPTLNVTHVTGSGITGLGPGGTGQGVATPEVNSTEVGYGATAKAGIYIPIVDEFGVDLEYKFVYQRLNVDRIRSLQSNVEIDGISHFITLGFSFRFEVFQQTLEPAHAGIQKY